jgi:hypothetical protein
MSPTPPLTVQQRSCLLRAARQRLTQLHDEYDASHSRGDIDSQQEVLFTEIACVTQAIAWLWRQPAT